MPAALDPNNTFEIVLERDQKKPKAGQPRFVYRYLTGRQWLKVAEVQENLTEHENMADLVAGIFGACRIGLVGWRNITGLDGKKIPFNPNNLEDILTLKEAQELALMLMNNGPTSEDKKKFDSPSDSDTVGSAKIAPDPENAKANQPQNDT